MNLSSLSNKDNLRGEWQQLSGAIQKQWGQLTDDDLLQAKGDWNVVTGKLRSRYAYGKQEADTKLDAFVRNWQLNDPFNKSKPFDPNGMMPAKVANSLNQASDSLGEATTAVKDNAVELGKAVDTTVKKRRWPLMFLALLVGLATGYMLGSNS